MFIHCENINFDVSFLPEEVRELVEKEMFKSITDKVLEVHHYKLPDTTEYENGRQRTRVKLEDGKLTNVWANSHEEMIQKLYEHYYGDSKDAIVTFGEAFEKMIEHDTQFEVVKEKTLKDYRFDYNRFFKGDEIERIPLTKITTRQMALFLNRAHLKTSKLDQKRGMKHIEKHRHNGIRTVINEVFAYANLYLEVHAINPISLLDYSRFAYYDGDKLDKPYYNEEERAKLGEAFDSIELPNLEDLCAGFLIETAGRNSECRAIRFKDFHFKAGVPYVRICGMAEKSHRDERIKADSYAGMRNLVITPRLERIYNLAKLASWSDEFPFVRDPSKIIGEEILITSQGLQRAFKRLCVKAGVKYLPPHQIRFSDATLMALEGRGSEIQGRMGHTTSRMAEHYIRKAACMTPASGPCVGHGV